MPLIIQDEVLRQAGLSERDALLEFACALFDAEKLDVHQASRLLGMDRHAFEDELAKRNIPVYRYTEEHFEQDMAALEKLRRMESGAK